MFNIRCDQCEEEVTEKGWYEFRATRHSAISDIDHQLEEDVHSLDLCFKCYAQHSQELGKFK